MSSRKTFGVSPEDTECLPKTPFLSGIAAPALRDSTHSTADRVAREVLETDVLPTYAKTRGCRREALADQAGRIGFWQRA